MNNRLQKVHFKLPNIFKLDLRIPIGFLSVRYSYTEWTFIFLGLAVFFLPFDSLPYFPIRTTYRPFSIIVLFAALALFIRKGRMMKFDVAIIALVLFTILHAMIMSSLLFGEFGQIKKVVITMIMLAGMVMALNRGISYHMTQLGVEVFMKKITQFVVISFWIGVGFGVIQLLAQFGLVPRGISELLTKLVSYRSAGRLQMVSGEPSQMIRNLLCFWPFLYYFYHGESRKWIIRIFVFFVILSGSTYGYLTLMLWLFAHTILFNATVKTFRNVFIALTLLCGVLFAAYNLVLNSYTRDKFEKVVTLAQDPAAITLIFARDGSIFQRVANPTIGFLSGTDSNYMGLGLDNYRYVYPKYIYSHFPQAAHHEPIQKVLEGQAYITPKSLYSKIFAELGLVPFIMFIGMLILLYYKIRVTKCSKQLKGFLASSFSLLTVLIINTDSIIYFNFYFLLILLFAITHQTSSKCQNL